MSPPGRSRANPAAEGRRPQGCTHEPARTTAAARRPGKPIRVGLIGAGKFGSMYLAQIPRTPGVHLVGIADLSPDSGARATWRASAGSDAQTQRGQRSTRR